MSAPRDGSVARASAATHDSTSAISTEWDQLAERLDATPFARPGWFDAWLAAFPVARPLIVTARRGTELVGVMALAERNGVRASLTNWHSPRFEPLALDGDAARALAREALQARRLSLAFVETSTPAVATILTEAHASGYRVHRREAEESPEVAIRGSWEEYLPTISKNMRREFKRRQKRLAEAGELSFEVNDGASEHTGALEEAFAVEAASWKGEAGTAVAADAATLEFYREVAAWAAARGWLRICLMRLNGVPIASDFALESNGIFYSLKGGYDPAYAEYSPGRLMDGLEIRRAHELGLRRFEFGGDAEHHKLQWRPQFRQLEHVDAFAPGTAGKIDHFAAVHGRRLARRVRAGTRTLLRR